MLPKRASLIFALLLCLPATATAGLFGDPVKPFVAPDRMFAVKVPPSWQIVLSENPNEVQFHPQGNDKAFMFVRRLDVPEGADPIQLALRAIEDRLAKMPSFNLTSKKRVTIAGQQGASVTGTYAFMGNIQYPRVVEEVFVVVGREAFVLHFDCFEAKAQAYASPLGAFYGSFVPRPEANAMPKEEKPFPEVETMPF